MPNRLLVVIAVILSLGALKLSQPVTLPLAIAAFILALVWPLTAALSRRIPAVVAVALTSLLLLLLLAGLAFGVSRIVAQVAERGPEIGERITELSGEISDWAGARGIPIPGAEAEGEEGGKELATQAVSAAAPFAIAIPNALLTLVLIGAFVVLGLLEIPKVKGRLESHMSSERASFAEELVTDAATKTRRYMIAIGLVALIAGTTTGVVTWLLGVELALLWGLLTVVLDIVPVIGPIIAIIPPTLMALLQFDDFTRPAMVLFGVGLLQFVIGWFVEPLVAGRVLSLSPFGILVFIVLWGWIWGPVGALLAVPIMVTFVVVGQRFESTAWLAGLFSREHQGTK